MFPIVVQPMNFCSDATISACADMGGDRLTLRKAQLSRRSPDHTFAGFAAAFRALARNPRASRPRPRRLRRLGAAAPSWQTPATLAKNEQNPDAKPPIFLKSFLIYRKMRLFPFLLQFSLCHRIPSCYNRIMVRLPFSEERYNAI